MALQDLVRAMEEPATQDIRALALTTPLMRALGHPTSARLKDAMTLLRGWAATGGHRRDLDKNGHYDDDAGVTLMDAWWPRMLDPLYKPVLGAAASTQPQDIPAFGAPPVGRTASDYPSFSDGW